MKITSSIMLSVIGLIFQPALALDCTYTDLEYVNEWEATPASPVYIKSQVASKLGKIDVSIQVERASNKLCRFKLTHTYQEWGGACIPSLTLRDTEYCYKPKIEEGDASFYRATFPNGFKLDASASAIAATGYRLSKNGIYTPKASSITDPASRLLPKKESLLYVGKLGLPEEEYTKLKNALEL